MSKSNPTGKLEFEKSNCLKKLFYYQLIWNFQRKLLNFSKDFHYFVKNMSNYKNIVKQSKKIEQDLEPLLEFKMVIMMKMKVLLQIYSNLWHLCYRAKNTGKNIAAKIDLLIS